jgi:acyl-CoA dehydrogenase
MTAALWVLALLLMGSVVAYRRLERTPATAVLGATLLLASVGGLSWWLALPLWLLWLAVTVLLFADDWRREYVTAPVLDFYRRKLPPLSDTEREAMQAGSVWWERELFSGQPDWERLGGFVDPPLGDDEQAFLDGPVERLCAQLDDWRITHVDADLPPQVWQTLREEGFFGLIIPTEFGGKGFSHRAHSAVVMKLASRSVTAAITVMVPNSLGPAELIRHYGTQAQKDHYLPRLASGQDIPCFALTGPQAGSDAGALPDVGVVCRGQHEGEAVLGVRLSFEKRYITLGPVATLLGVAFKTYDPEHLLGEEEELGISLALIPTDTAGVSIGRRHLPLGAAFMNGPNWGKDVFVPLEAIIGGREMIGKGWMMLMNCLSVGRSISLPATGTSAAKVCSYTCGRYAQIREQFNVPLAAFEGIQEPLARIAGNAWLMDAARTLTANAVDLGEKPSVLSAILKYHLTERGRACITDAMDIHGGKGIILGPNNYLGRMWLSAPISITVEGANILSRNLMIFGQGAIRCHPYVLREMNAARVKDKARSLREFDEALLPARQQVQRPVRLRHRHGDADARRLPEAQGASLGAPRRRALGALHGLDGAEALREPGPARGRPAARRVELPHAALRGPGAAARLPAQLPESLGGGPDAIGDLPARTYLLRPERPPRPPDRRAADDSLGDARSPLPRHLQDGRARQPDRTAAGGAGAVGVGRAARETAARRRREDGTGHGARPARADRAGRGHRAAERRGGRAAARLRPQGHGHRRRGRVRERGADGCRAVRVGR